MIPHRDGKVLTDEALADYEDFERCGRYECTCFISPPCGWCTHPGNPLNLEECDDCWQDEDVVGAMCDQAMSRLRKDIQRSCLEQLAAHRSMFT